MSSPTVHVIQAVGGTAALYPLVGENALVFGASIVLIDTDHILEYACDTKNLHPKGFFLYYDLLTQNVDKNFLSLNIFHTLECYTLLGILSMFFPVLLYVLLGFLFHHAFDQINLIRIGYPFARAFSFVEYFIKRKNPKYLVSIHEVMQCDNLHVDGIPDLDRWLTSWNVEIPHHKLKLSKSTA